jgi:hypothetical protein
MSANAVPAIKNGSLVLYTPNKGQGHYGVVIEVIPEGVRVYDFLEQCTYTVPLDSCLPFRKEDYVAMCSRNFWTGVTVQFPNKKVGTINTARMDIFGQECELWIYAEAGQTYQWVPLSWFVTIGHINAT